MEIPHDLSTHLTKLSKTLDANGTDLLAVLSVLVDDLVTAVPSFLGLSMTLPQQPAPAAVENAVTLNFLPPARAGSVGTTLQIPVQAPGISGCGGTVLFYAARPGAFVDLAADIRFAYGRNGRIILDQHLPSPNHPPRPSGVSGHAHASTINRAIGVLIGRGHTPENARSILQHRADQDEIPLLRVAEQLLTHSPR